jgi:hypothetical protein
VLDAENSAEQKNRAFGSNDQRTVERLKRECRLNRGRA